MAYAGEARFRFKGPADVCSRYIPVARVLVERTMAMYDIGGGGADAATQTQILRDGTAIKVTVFAQVPPIITITAGPDERGEGSVISRELQFYFHTDDPSIPTGARYLPASIGNAYDRVTDEGRWQPRDLPLEENWVRQEVRVSNLDTRKATYFSLDIMLDGYPRYVTAWDDGDAHKLKPAQNSPYSPPSAYTINGQIVNAPGPVMGAIKDMQQDVVFVADIASGLTIEKYFWGTELSEPDWALDWSTEITDTGTVDGLANTMRISRDGLRAVFATRVQHAPSGDYYPVLTEIDLITGVATKIYGDAADYVAETRNESQTVNDTDFADDTIYDLYTTTEIIAGTTTSTTVTGDNGDISLYRAMPRVGDKFYIGGGPSSDNDGSASASVIQITSVTFTPETYSANGAVYSGSIAPHKGTSADIEFTYIQEGDDGGPVTHAANRRLRYVNSSGDVTWDYTHQYTQTKAGEYLLDYGYDENDDLTYSVVVVDELETQTETRITSAGDLIREVEFERTNNTLWEIRAGAQMGFQEQVNNQGFRFYETEGYDDLSFPADPVRFSGVDFSSGTGTMRAYLYDEVFYPVGTEIPSYSETAVNGTSTDDVSDDVTLTFLPDEAALALETVGLVYYLQNTEDSTPIADITYGEFGGGIKSRFLDITGDPTPAEHKFPYKESYTQQGWHQGTHRYTQRVVRLIDFGTGTGTVTPERTLCGTSDHHIAAASFTANPLWVRYGDTQALFAARDGAVAADPFHNVVIAVDRELAEDAAYTVRQDGYGYLYRAVGDHTSDDPRSVFGVLDGGGAVTGDSVYPVFWGAILTTVTREPATGNQRDGEIIDNRNSTYRR